MPRISTSRYLSLVPLTTGVSFATHSPTTDSSASGITRPISTCLTLLHDKASPWMKPILKRQNHSTTGAPTHDGCCLVLVATTGSIHVPISVMSMQKGMLARPSCCHNAIRAASIASASFPIMSPTSSWPRRTSIVTKPAAPSMMNIARTSVCASEIHHFLNNKTPCL